MPRLFHLPGLIEMASTTHGCLYGWPDEKDGQTPQTTATNKLPSEKQALSLPTPPSAFFKLGKIQMLLLPETEKQIRSPHVIFLKWKVLL